MNPILRKLPTTLSFTLLDQRLLTGAVALFLSLAWLLPNHVAPWLSLHAEVVASAAGVSLVLFALVSARGDAFALPVPALTLLLVAAIPWVHWLFGLVSYFGDALLASMYAVGTALCFWAGHRTALRDGHRLARAVAYAMLWSSILSTCIALYQWFGLTGLEIWALEGVPGARASGNIAQANHLATLLMFGLAATLWLHANHELQTAVAALAGGFLVLGVSLAGSRTPWLGLLLLGAWAVRSQTAGAATRAQRWLIVALLLWYGLAYCVVPYLPAAWHLIDVDPAAQNLGQTRLTAGLRPLLWSQYAQSLKEAPWFGYGWQGGPAAQAQAALLRPGLEVSAYAHNLLLDLLVWNGLPLGACLAALLVAWYFRVGNRVRANGGWFQFAVLTLFAVHAMLEYPHAYVYFLVPVALLAGQLHARHAGRTLACPRWLMPTAAAVVVSAMVAVVLDYVAQADDRREVMLWRAKVGGARTLPPPPPAWVLDQLSASARWARVTPAPGMTDLQIQEQRVVARRFPGQFLMRQSVLMLAFNGRPDEALTELHRLRGLHGEAPYRVLVDELRELSRDSHPGLAGLVQGIDATAPQLPRLPVVAEEMGRRGM